MHFPHSSIKAPKSLYNDVLISKEEVNQLTLKMGDILLLELFKYWNYKKIIDKYSRIYVDVEKYWDDKDEVMVKYGMGAVYEKDLYGRLLHIKTNHFMKEASKYYHDYHNKLGKTVIKEMVKHKSKTALLLDIHSFSDKQASLFTNGPYPDICIGYNKNDYDKEIIQEIERWCDTYNITYKENYPYEGAMTLNQKYYGNKDLKVHSIMLEINKRWYL